MRARVFTVGVLVVSMLTAVSANGDAASNGDLEVVAAFDAASGHLPEGVGLDGDGNLYVSLGPPFFVGGGYGEIRKIDRHGQETTLVEFPEGPAPAGVAVTPGGTVYFAVPDPGGPNAGVYRVTPEGPARLPGTEAMLIPNGVTVDRRGAVFASDSALGAIWRVPRHGAAKPWLTHELLAGCDVNQIGANGIAFWRGDLYVANSERGALVRIPVSWRGTPGEPEIVAGDDDCDPTDALYAMDGIAFDVRGTVYALLVLQNKLVEIDLRDGTSSVLLDEEDGLWNGASLAFGTRGGDRTSLYISNYAVLLPPGPDGNLGPAILRYDAGVPGAPVNWP